MASFGPSSQADPIVIIDLVGASNVIRVR